MHISHNMPSFLAQGASLVIVTARPQNPRWTEKKGTYLSCVTLYAYDG